MEKFKYISRDKISQLPGTAGVYAFKKGKEILYIGKTANIRERVKNHFQRPTYSDNLFINQVTKIGYIKTDSEFAEPSAHLLERSEERKMNEVQRATSRPTSQGSTIEALILEAKLIKKYQPKYNVVWRDDKNYFYVSITKELFPRIFITHQLENTSRTDYVGPFVDGRALKQTLKVLRKIFPYRSCYKIPNRPCLWHHLGRCLAPCFLKSKIIKEIPPGSLKIKKESQRNAKNLMKILKEGKNPALKELKKEMKLASKNQEFETAAKIRDQIKALEKILAHVKIFEGLTLPQTSPGYYKKIEQGLKNLLKIKGRISRIEAYDVSNIQGQEATGSMVTFINGLPDKNFYRKFKIKITGKPNDIAMIKEVLFRRFNHLEWGLPDLILIDGGIAQLNAALKVKSQKSKVKNIKIMALAKKKGKLHIENQKTPILLKTLPREIFNLILQLRDEAHRFAITYHKKLRERRLTPPLKFVKKMEISSF